MNFFTYSKKQDLYKVVKVLEMFLLLSSVL